MKLKHVVSPLVAMLPSLALPYTPYLSRPWKQPSLAFALPQERGCFNLKLRTLVKTDYTISTTRLSLLLFVLDPKIKSFFPFGKRFFRARLAR